MKYIAGKNRKQLEMFHSLETGIQHDNPVRLINHFIDLFVTKFSSELDDLHSETGRPAYHPGVFLKLYLYGYMHRISSSRSLEREAKINIELKWLLEDLQPDFWVIAHFRRMHGKIIEKMTQDFRLFLKNANYMDFKTVAIDGSKVKAYASDKMQNLKTLEKNLQSLHETVDAYLARLDINDGAEEGDDVPKKPSQIEEAIAQAKWRITQLEKAKTRLESEGAKSINLTDPDAKIMKSSQGYYPGYNVQVVADGKHKMIAFSEATTAQADQDQLQPVIAQMEAETAAKPENVLGDGGFFNMQHIRAIEGANAEGSDGQTQCYVAISAQVKQRLKDFKYDKEKDEFICKEGKRLPFLQQWKDKKSGLMEKKYKGKECESCPIKAECTRSASGRDFTVKGEFAWIENYANRMKEEEGREKYRQRKGIIEHIFGTLKVWMGKNPLKMRGKSHVNTEINLYATAYNLRRLMSIHEGKFAGIMGEMEKYYVEMA